MQRSETIASRLIYSGHVLDLRVDTVRLGDRPPVEREVADNINSVVVVAVSDEREVLLVRQWRHPVGRVLLEAPAGHVDPGETPRDAAARELREETGHAARNLTPLPGFWIAPGWATEYMDAYLATGLERSPLPQDEDEDVELARTPLNDVPRLIREGAIADAKTIAALLSALCLYPEALPGG